MLGEFQQVKPKVLLQEFYEGIVIIHSTWIRQFGDASQRAYAAIMYLVIETPDGCSTQ